MMPQSSALTITPQGYPQKNCYIMGDIVLIIDRLTHNLPYNKISVFEDNKDLTKKQNERKKERKKERKENYIIKMAANIKIISFYLKSINIIRANPSLTFSTEENKWIKKCHCVTIATTVEI